MELTNFYRNIKKIDNSLFNYPNEQRLNITLPARILLLGPSGSGKTNVTMNIIKHIGTFDKVVLLAKNLDEPLYKYLIDAYRALEKKEKVRILLAISDLKDMPCLSDFDPKENNLLIVDDFVCDSPKELKKLDEYWIRGRKNSITMMFLSQSYFDTPKIIRKNSNYIIIKKIGNPKDLKRILSEYKLGINDQTLETMYHQAVSGDFTNFFMIDLATTEDRLKFRTNFG